MPSVNEAVLRLISPLMKDTGHHLFRLQGLVFKDERNTAPHHLQPASAVKHRGALSHDGHWNTKIIGKESPKGETTVLQTSEHFTSQTGRVYSKSVIRKDFTTSKVGRTDRWSGRYKTLFLRSCCRRCTSLFCHTLLYHLLHISVVEQREGNLVHTQVRSL